MDATGCVFFNGKNNGGNLWHEGARKNIPARNVDVCLADFHVEMGASLN